MEKQVLSVVPETFRDKGGKVTQMYRVYLAAFDGRIGYLYATKELKPGQMVAVDLRERDGKLLPKLMV